MRSLQEVQLIQLLIAQGLNDCEIARITGIPRGTVKDWRHGRVPRRPRGSAGGCPVCGHAQHDPRSLPAADYAYLLGLYLGDGYIVEGRRSVFWLRVFLDNRYPGIIASCSRAMEAVIGKRPNVIQRVLCDLIGVEWRRMNDWNISVAKRASVAELDRFIGPKR